MNEEPGFTTPPAWLMAALQPLDEELKGFCDRVIATALKAGEGQEVGTGHNATVAALTIFAIRLGVITIARAAEVNEDAHMLTVTSHVIRDIANGTGMTITKLMELEAAKPGGSAS